MSYSDEINIGFRRKTKIRSQDRKLPMIDFGKRVINFGDDQELFNVVCKMIMVRVDLDPDDLGPYLSGNSGNAADNAIVDLDALPAPDGEPAPDTAGPAPQRRKLSEMFGLYRHPDRYGAP